LLHLLKPHGVPIEAHLTASLVLAYAVPQDALKPLFAPGLELDTYDGFGFLAIAMVETRDLCPASLPLRTGGFCRADRTRWPAPAGNPRGPAGPCIPTTPGRTGCSLWSSWILEAGQTL